MIELFMRTFFICFLMEIGSASSFTIAAIANSSQKWGLVLFAGYLGILGADFLAVKLGNYLSRLPISSNLLSGIIMLFMGFLFLFKEAK